MGNRVLYTQEYVQRFRSALAAALATARDEISAQHLADHNRRMGELAALRDEVRELRSILTDVVRCSREKAEGDVAALRRQLEISIARLERPRKPLH
jgi:hypothetical protein